MTAGGCRTLQLCRLVSSVTWRLTQGNRLLYRFGGKGTA
jgi:hypothetical protein